MSDKKQPAQQRVNVRIVKADDPEQRGGMKPIAKADGSLQISPEEAYTAGIWTKPPFDLRGLSKMVDESTILPQCIRAYKSNIAGFGIDIRYKDDFADADETPEMKAEWDRATEVVEMLNMEQESNELFEDIVEARETYGCAYAEVIRDMDGNVIQLEFIEDTPSVEKSRRLDPRVDVTYFHRDHTENRMRKFRKYKQTVNGKTVYYKEFGDPRIMDPTSGEYVAELEFKSRANEIIEFAIGTATYGKVRWVGSILTVDGARRAESLNNNYFLNGRHTPLLIMVKGGSLTDDSFAKLKEYMNGIRGEAGQHSFMVLETEAADNRTGFNAENRPEVEVKDLAAILQKDELFQDYLENNRRKVQSAFQLPDLYTGYTTDFNRATAQTAMEVTEKQVFQPERRRLAWAINNRLLNCYQFKYVEVFFRAPDVSNPDDLYKLQTIRSKLGKAIKVTSGYRCVKHNADPKVGGSRTSRHLYGIAADWRTKDRSVNPVALGIIAAAQGFGAVGIYWHDKAAIVHTDMRGGKATWLCVQPGVYPSTTYNKFVLPTIEQGCEGAANRAATVMLQRLLGIPHDGSFGPATTKALMTAQRKHGLVPDGICGPKSWTALSGADKYL